MQGSVDIRRSLSVIPPIPRAAGWYLSAGWNDHTDLVQFLADGGNPTGVVVTAAFEHRQRELRAEARQREVDVILDPHTVEQAFVGGIARGSVQRLPWSRESIARPRDFRGRAGAVLVRQIVDAIVRMGCTSVISPSHLLPRGTKDRWFETDLLLTLRLRRELDRRGLGDLRIYYRLALPGALLREEPDMPGVIVSRLRRFDIDAVWLRLHPSGPHHVGPHVVHGYLGLAKTLHQLRVPLVMEHSGYVGLAMLAYGAVGGVEGGIADGDSFDIGGLRAVPEPSDDGGFGPPVRVFVPELFSYLLRADAEKFFANRLMRARYACDRTCCSGRGADESARHFRRHALHCKAELFDFLSKTPEHRRATVFVADLLKSAIVGLVQARAVVGVLDSPLRRLVRLEQALTSASKNGLRLRYDLPSLGERVARQRRVSAARPHLVS